MTANSNTTDRKLMYTVEEFLAYGEACSLSAYSKGFKEGYEEGHEDGYCAGFKAGESEYTLGDLV